jgi:lipopolysaccharide transport system ATP-binding protein
MNTEQNHSSPEKHELGEVLVRAENVSKIFCRNLKRSLFYGLRDGIGDIVPGVGRKYNSDGTPILRKGEFWANQGISFELRRGECLGLIGRNGAGKTTLLKMLNGLIKPDTGHIEIRGKVGAIIALNAGFNPLLTGRENIYIAGSIRGLSKKEIDAKYDEIVDFAELHEFMESPVQNYSSGMQVRLGFSIASIIKPDVLIIDEVLAVGDFSFRMKCYRKISSLLKSTAVIFVSHQIEHIKKMCNVGLYLRSGKEVSKGDILSVIKDYERNNIQNQGSKDNYVDDAINGIHAEIKDSLIQFGGNLSIGVNYDIKENSIVSRVRFVFFDYNGSPVAEWDSINHMDYISAPLRGKGELLVTMENIRLKPGVYSVKLIASNSDNQFYLCNVECSPHITIEGNRQVAHIYQI